MLAELPHDLVRHVECGTVDSYQGWEFPVVLLSCSRSNDRGNVGFLSQLSQRINVVFSRAQRQLVVIGDSSTICHPSRGSRWLREAFELINDGTVPGRVIESL